MGYQPPFIDLNELKLRLKHRVDYYRVHLHMTYTGDLNIVFCYHTDCVVIICIKKEKNNADTNL